MPSFVEIPIATVIRRKAPCRVTIIVVQFQEQSSHLEDGLFCERSVNVNPSGSRNVLYEYCNVAGRQVHRLDGLTSRGRVVELLPGHRDILPVKPIHLQLSPARPCEQ